MKILFVENRYKTKQWEIIGQYLEANGHEIFWLVQNPIFKPRGKNIEIIPFPKYWSGKKEYNESLKKIIRGHRGINYYGLTNDDHIFHYKSKIDEIIYKIKPDFVFGESTLFHELITIEICRRNNILYLHPTSCRYPTNRFSFYQYDSLEPYGNSNQDFSVNEYIKIIEEISNRKVKPNYMKKIEHRYELLKNIYDLTKLSVGYILGERYNTPNPFTKIKNLIKYNNNKLLWDSIALENIENTQDYIILFPLQMQPEANIDVWGYPYSNQTEVIKWIINNMSDKQKLVIKPNPKSKFEITDELLELVEVYKDKIILLKHEVSMEKIWDRIDLFITITGTISIECLLSNKPVFQFGESIQTELFPEIKINYLTSLQEKIKSIANVIKVSEPLERKINYLKYIVNTSFPGTLGDGLHNKKYLFDENQIMLKEAFLSIMEVNNKKSNE